MSVLYKVNDRTEIGFCDFCSRIKQIRLLQDPFVEECITEPYEGMYKYYCDECYEDERDQI